MQNIILISHGSMAEGVKASLEMIVGKQDHVHVVALTPEGDNRQFEEELLKKMKALNGSSLIIADLLGGTPCNVALSNYLESENVEIIAGMSLPLVIEATLNSTATVKELIQAATTGIVDVKQKMKQTEIEKEPSLPMENSQLYEAYKGKENIVNVRIDERLIHGQVAGIWAPSLHTQRIIVINDEAAADTLQKSSLRMAAPTSMRLSVLPVESAAKNIRSGKYGKQRLFLVFKNPTDVLRYLKAGGKLTHVNVGNMSYKEGSKDITKSIKVLEEEIDVFESIAAMDINVTAQLVPNDPVIDFMDKLRN
ncbi:PTS mannose/fructose/sorbose transporter subunit IIAB [Enterococcus faecium]|uniref:PTS mannose/fructose/sorbose transporter subunit IIAB n=1 Tax=Enterococcus faecium TaxID=1352 RepID=UPI000A33ABB8|nr:PTS mannose/fructose/sorbose transporter subunit IIAB [Enterococcus faecium]EGP4758334.1 PTS transporter subunit IIB [Enterococcus faecium]EGP4982757.1 PTS transporter subunit IIB [Enterococcus faecium]EGP5415701.1 PTS mannose/fructose/sorbose transporter subunit IIAB [Enterococcus faecium]EGP5711101.1 PTS mannose/fructose/sorbose transporter subunit IIAB [Enterococcus faecium]EGP5720073.1 PTS mannose/fructose/sorbose transporter subunit IIAB [Enterococcus faecium]